MLVFPGKAERGLERFFVPEGLQDSARGFNQVSTPEISKETVRLKGRKLTWINPTY
jgi:hypothetical protein